MKVKTSYEPKKKTQTNIGHHEAADTLCTDFQIRMWNDAGKTEKK